MDTRVEVLEERLGHHWNLGGFPEIKEDIGRPPAVLRGEVHGFGL
jgi:hypothetical protein